MAASEAILARALLLTVLRPLVEAAMTKLVSDVLNKLDDDAVIAIVRDSDSLDAEVRSMLGIDLRSKG